MNINSVETVGDAASSLGIYALCGAPFTQALPLIFPHCFSLRNSSDESAFVQSSLASLVGSITVYVSITWSWVNSEIAAVAPCSPNFLRPGLRLYWVIKYPHTAISSSLVVCNYGSTWCTVSSTLRFELVVACISALLVGSSRCSRHSCAADRALLCAHTSPSCRSCILGV